MTWNYRIIKRENEIWTYFAIYEVYYNKNGKITSWSEPPISPYGEDDVEDLKRDFKLMEKAFEKPILIEMINKKGKEVLKEVK